MLLPNKNPKISYLSNQNNHSVNIRKYVNIYTEIADAKFDSRWNFSKPAMQINYGSTEHCSYLFRDSLISRFTNSYSPYMTQRREVVSVLAVGDDSEATQNIRI